MHKLSGVLLVEGALPETARDSFGSRTISMEATMREANTLVVCPNSPMEGQASEDEQRNQELFLGDWGREVGPRSILLHR